MRIVGLIPGRMASTRFPGKPLARIAGIPMIGHVLARCRLCPLLDEVHVATCDRDIAAYVESIGGSAVMTKDTHERASDRCAEALTKVERRSGRRADIAVMIQGDEPLVTPRMISTAVRAMREDPKSLVVNLAAPLTDEAEFNDPNEIKVVMGRDGDALYFSREPIPTLKKGAKGAPMWKQVCVMPFRRDFLYKFLRLSPTPLEVAESIDMLRVLEHGYPVTMAKIAEQPYSVDTPEDLRFVEGVMRKDPLFRRYAKSLSPRR